MFILCDCPHFRRLGISAGISGLFTIHTKVCWRPFKQDRPSINHSILSACCIFCTAIETAVMVPGIRMHRVPKIHIDLNGFVLQQCRHDQGPLFTDQAVMNKALKLRPLSILIHHFTPPPSYTTKPNQFHTLFTHSLLYITYPHTLSYSPHLISNAILLAHS